MTDPAVSPFDLIREAKLHVYWCPICHCQTEKRWHTASRPVPLIPQLDEEHECERVEVVPRAALHLRDHEAAVREAETLRAALMKIERMTRGWTAGDMRRITNISRAALASSRDTTETVTE